MALDSSFYILAKHQRTSIILLVVQMILTLKPALVYIYVPATTLLCLGVFLSIFAYVLSPKSFCYTNRSRIIAILFLLAAFISTRGNTYAYIGTTLRCLPFLLFIGATDQYKCALLQVFNKCFWWIIAISLFFWILYLFGVPFPHNTLTKADSIYVFDNYYVFVKGAYSVDFFFPRFCSIFMEPGYVACFVAFMLYVDKYNLRNKQNIFYLIALILTFSIAGWLLFFVGLLPYVGQQGKGKWAYWLFLIAIIATYIYASGLSDSVVGTMIGERMRFENGEMVGYNRANIELEDYWDNYFWNSGNVLMGLGESYFLFDFGSSVDLRAYIIKYGLLSAILYIIFILACFLLNRSRYGLWLFILVIAFVYRGYSIMFYDATLFVYVAAITLMRLEKEAN